MIHFCFIIQGFLLKENEDNIAGPHVQTYLKAKALIKNGFKVSYICLTNDLDYYGKSEQKENINVYYVARKTRPYRLEELFSMREITRILNEINPDIVYTRGRTSLPWISYKYCKKRNKISVWNAARDRDFFRYSYLKEKSKNSFIKYLFSFPFYYTTMIFLFERGLKKSNLVFTQNELQRELLERNFKIKNSILLPQLVSEKEFYVKKQNGKLKILWIGSLKSEKAPEKYIDVVDAYSGNDIEFNMIGKILDSKYEYVKELKKNNFRYIGPLSYQKTNELFKESDILINTSLNEGFPNTYVQAWRYGLMVISLGINPNNLLNGKLGFCCSSTEEIIQKINNIKDYNLLGENKEYIEEYIDSNHSEFNFINNINNLLKS